jgi:phosphoribosylaminoimidazole (AIR) synthetase
LSQKEQKFCTEYGENVDITSLGSKIAHDLIDRKSQVQQQKQSLLIPTKSYVKLFYSNLITTKKTIKTSIAISWFSFINNMVRMTSQANTQFPKLGPSSAT